jgi:hypothetical protein
MQQPLDRYIHLTATSISAKVKGLKRALATAVPFILDKMTSLSWPVISTTVYDDKTLKNGIQDKRMDMLKISRVNVDS